MPESVSTHTKILSHVLDAQGRQLTCGLGSVYNHELGAWIMATRVENTTGGDTASWNLSMAPDGTGVILEQGGRYLTDNSRDWPQHRGSTLTLSSDISDAAHLITADPGVAGKVCLALERNTALYLTLRTDGIRVSFESRKPGNNLPSVQEFERPYFVLIQPTAFGDIVPISSDFFKDDLARFSDDTNYFALQSDGRIRAVEPNKDQASNFAMEAEADNKLILRINNTYLSVGSASEVRTGASRLQATRFVIYATPTEGVVIATAEARPRYWNLNPDGVLIASAQSKWSRRLEFWMEIEPMIPEAVRLARLGITVADDPIFTACERATAKIVLQCTGGLLIAAGVGPGIINGEPAAGFVALIKSLMPTIGPAIDTVVTALTTQGATTIYVCGAVFDFVVALFRGGVWWDIFREMIMTAVSWWAIPTLMSRMVRYFFPTAPISAVAAMASLFTWFTNTGFAAANVIISCGRSEGSTALPPGQTATA